MNDSNAIAAFHRRTAEELARSYAGHDDAPDGWRATLAWHWEQAGAFAEAAAVALEVAQARLTVLDFNDARAWIERVLTLLNKMDDGARQAFELRAYALTVIVLEFAGQYREGLGYARLLLRLAEERGTTDARARAYLTIGRMQRELGQLAVAEAEMLRALALAEQAEQRDLESEVRLHLAKVHQMQGRHLEALQQLQLAQEEVGTDDRMRLARIFTGIGDVYRVLGAGRESLQLYNQALKLEIGSNNRVGQAMLYEKLGLSHMELGALGEALDCQREALRLREELDDLVGQARSESILGTVQSKLGDHTLALRHFVRAHDLETQLQNRRGMIMALTHVGDARNDLGDLDQARANYVEGLTLARDSNDQVALARIHQRMGDLDYQQHVPDAASAHWSEALRIREELGHFEETQALRARLQSGPPMRRRR